jgi:glyoxylase-like metal-dependent hydrolase (beta-lactamase superfamily II)
MTRRLFIAEIGRGTLAVAVLGGLAACAAGSSGSTSSEAELGSTTTGVGADTSAASSPTTVRSAPTTSGAAAADWHRVNLGFVSAYLMSRSGEVAVVDTGVPNSGPAIADGLAAIESGWHAVSHVILTHRHHDHVGGLNEVMDLAASATGYCGAGDLDAISSPRALTAVGDGDAVFGLDIIDTPGHTPGHIAVLDPIAGILLAGDALHGSGGGVAGARPEFTDDMAAANQSIIKLSGFTYGVALFGHGEPVVTGASQAVAELAATL